LKWETEDKNGDGLPACGAEVKNKSFCTIATSQNKDGESEHSF
jgi:hypothetical protein